MYIYIYIYIYIWLSCFRNMLGTTNVCLCCVNAPCLVHCGVVFPYNSTRAAVGVPS